MLLPLCAPGGPHDHGGQRQGVRGPCLFGEGARCRVLLCRTVPLLGARPERARQRPGPGVLPEGDRHFRQITDAQVKTVQDRLNARPEKVLGYRAPAEVFHRAYSP